MTNQLQQVNNALSMPIDPVLIKEVRFIMKHQPDAQLTAEQQTAKEWILKRRAYERKYCRQIIDAKARKRAIVKAIELDAKTNPEKLNTLTQEQQEIYDYVMKLRKNERIANAKQRAKQKLKKTQVIDVSTLTNYMDNYIETEYRKNEASASDSEGEGEESEESESEGEESEGEGEESECEESEEERKNIATSK